MIAGVCSIIAASPSVSNTGKVIAGVVGGAAGVAAVGFTTAQVNKEEKEGKEKAAKMEKEEKEKAAKMENEKKEKEAKEDAKKKQLRLGAKPALMESHTKPLLDQISHRPVLNQITNFDKSNLKKVEAAPHPAQGRPRPADTYPPPQHAGTHNVV